MAFTPAALLPAVERLGEERRITVALSGGLDSMVLLDALHRLRQSQAFSVALRAVHVHHGLHPQADQWLAHCAEACGTRGVVFVAHRVSVATGGGQSLEAAARAARYGVLEAETLPGDCLMTAHHADDQAETLLLQLLRGSGPHGLAAMPPMRPFGRGCLIRPLLGFQRAELAAWAARVGLRWVEDATNREPRFDRNFLRHTILPPLRERWPALAQTLSRSARLCGEAAELLDALAELDLAGARTGLPRQLRWPPLARHAAARRRNLLRHWIAQCGFPLPNAKRLDRMAVELWEAGADRNPALRWGGAELHRYRDRLHLIRALAAVDPGQRLRWTPPAALELPDGGHLAARRGIGRGLAIAALGAGELEVRFRRGGERCRPAGRSGSRLVKKLLQEQGVPPWLRDRIPLLYCGETLVAVAHLIVCEGFTARPGEAGWLLTWEPPGG